MARDAVFRSWMNDRAIYYRKQNQIPDDIGTAVNVQAMVFGNRDDDSGTGTTANAHAFPISAVASGSTTADVVIHLPRAVVVP